MERIFLFSIAIACLFPTILWADFTEGNLFVVNEPSSVSAGYDFILEFSPEGDQLDTLIPKTLNILGMSDLAFDPVSEHFFYTVNNWNPKIFEIREVDKNGTLLHTYTHSEFGSGNIELVFDREGNLFIANDDFIYKKEVGNPDIIQLFELPYTGIGDLEMDRHGNLYLSDPFLNDIVYKITPDGTATTFADGSDGLQHPYGLAMDGEGNLYVANTHPSAPATIVRVDPLGNAALFAGDISFQPIIIDMAIDVDGVLYASCRFDNTILKFDPHGSWTTFADSEDGLLNPSSMAFIIFPSACRTDFDGDNDVDGSDLASFAAAFDKDCLEIFAEKFGRTDCPQ